MMCDSCMVIVRMDYNLFFCFLGEIGLGKFIFMDILFNIKFEGESVIYI